MIRPAVPGGRARNGLVMVLSSLSCCEGRIRSARDPDATRGNSLRARVRSLRSAGFAFLAGSIACAAGCTDDPAPELDTQGPQVRILFPPERFDPPWHNEDLSQTELDVYVAAVDDGVMQGVSVFYSHPRETNRRLIGSTSEPVPISAIPEEVRAAVVFPPDWLLYRVRWDTTPLACGYRTLFAKAVDGAGNAGTAGERIVLWLNDYCFDVEHARIDFIVVPPEGPITTDFVFDAIGSDPENPLSLFGPFLLDQVQIRWDFDGDGSGEWDGNWDIDWDDGAMVTDRQTHRYMAPGFYRVRAQLRVRFVDALTVIHERLVVVLPEP